MRRSHINECFLSSITMQNYGRPDCQRDTKLLLMPDAWCNLQLSVEPSPIPRPRARWPSNQKIKRSEVQWKHDSSKVQRKIRAPTPLLLRPLRRSDRFGAAPSPMPCWARGKTATPGSRVSGGCNFRPIFEETGNSNQFLRRLAASTSAAIFGEAGGGMASSSGLLSTESLVICQFPLVSFVPY